MYDFLRIWGIIFAPIHELGHIVFGWLSFNPTIPVAWNEVASMRDGFIQSLGGVAGAFIFPVLLLYRFRAKKWLYIPVAIHILETFWSIRFQIDLQPFRALEAVGIMLWVVIGAAAVVAYVGILVKSREEEQERRRKLQKVSDDLKRTRGLVAEQERRDVRLAEKTFP